MKKISLIILTAMLLFSHLAMAQFQVVANDDVAILPGLQPIQICVLDNDTPQNALDSNTLGVITPPQFGNVEVVGACIMYFPNQNFPGGDNFSYQICAGPNQCDVARVDIKQGPGEEDDYGVPINSGQIIVDYGTMSAAQINAMRIKIQAMNGTIVKSCNCGNLELWSFSDTGTISTEEKKKIVTDTIGPASGGAAYNYPRIFRKPNLRPECMWKTNPTAATMKSKVLTALIDSGTDFNNRKLHGSYWLNSHSSPCAEGTNLGYNALDPTDHPNDGFGHGLHVAGLAHIDNPASKLLISKVFDDAGNGTLFETVCGLHFAINKKADVINMSLGYYGEKNEIFQRAMDKAYKAGTIVVCSAGNDHKDIDGTVPHWPSNFSHKNIITVAAMDGNNHLASFSNYGKRSVDIGAPGVHILSESLPAPLYTGVQSGTSMAAAFVSREVSIFKSNMASASAPEIIEKFYATLTPAPSLVGKSTIAKSLSIKSMKLICYCLPEKGSTSGRNYIDGVELGSIRNFNTGKCNGPAYSDFTEMRTNLLFGKEYSLSLKAGNGRCLGSTSTQFEAWIDYDQNGEFTPNESLGFVVAQEPGELVKLNFKVASDALSGFTRLRIRSATVESQNVGSMDPCKEYQFGETEDYTVNLTKLLLKLEPTRPIIKPINPKFKLRNN